MEKDRALAAEAAPGQSEQAPGPASGLGHSATVPSAVADRESARGSALRAMNLHDEGDAALAFDKGWDARGEHEILLCRLTAIYPDGREWRDHFVSTTEAELYERAATISGATTLIHPIAVPSDPGRLAVWLNDYCREQVSA